MGKFFYENPFCFDDDLILHQKHRNTTYVSLKSLVLSFKSWTNRAAFSWNGVLLTKKLSIL